MTTTFLSYSRGDDEPFVKRLYEDLSQQGFDVWWDRLSMPNRALTFLHEIREAITQRDRLIFVVGPKAISSDYVEAEWRYALETGKAISPVLRLGDYDLLPEELKLLDAPDFRDNARYAEQLEKLIRQISEPVAPMGKLVAVPSLPPHLLKRPDRLRALKDSVLSDLRRPVVVTGTAARVGIHGMGGIGKSVLATTLARDHEVRRAFPDGIIWIPFGQQPSLMERQREVAKALDDPGHFDTAHEGKAKLGELLAHRAVLLILDDVWEAVHAEAFDVLGPRCRMIITTRDASLITALGGTQHQVQLLTEAEALALLAQWAECPVDALPPAAREVMSECGRLPLALSICGAMVRDGTPWTDVLAALREADLEFLNHPHGSVLKSIKVSVDALAPEQQRRFAELAVFAPDETVPEAAVLTLWTHTGQMQERNARQLLTILERRSLLRLDTEAPNAGEAPKRRISLHDLLRDYAIQLAGDTKELHNQLIEAYRKHCLNGWPTGPNDGYFLQNLCHHLAEAGMNDELVSLLFDLSWIEAKAAHGLVFDLQLDYAKTASLSRVDTSERRRLAEFENFLRRQSHVLAAHPALTFQQAANQPDVSAPAVVARALWDTGSETRPWLQWVNKPQHRDPCLMTLSGHTSWVHACAYSPDGRRIVSGSEDETLKVWEAETGEEVATLEGHSYGVTACAYSPDGRRVVSGSYDKTLKVWEAETGEEVATLKGHSGEVTACAYSPDGRRIVSGSEDETLKVWEAETGEEVATFVTEGPVYCAALVTEGSVYCAAQDRAGRSIVAGDGVGRVYILRLMGFEVATPMITPVHLYRFDKGQWDTQPTTRCEWCGQRFAPIPTILDAIAGIARTANLSPDQSPCFALPAEAWYEPRLLSECPHCHEPLKFNPFVVDNRDRTALKKPWWKLWK